MPSQSERRALTLLTVVFTLGVAVRLAGLARNQPPAASADLRALDAQIARVESARTAAGTPAGTAARGRDGGRPPSRRRAPGRRPSTRETATRRVAAPPPEPARAPRPVDLDAAGAQEIERLPWIGPALAARIVASRDKCGPFGSLQALTRVYGIGEKLAARLAPHVTFSGPSRPMDAVRPGCAGTAPAATTRRRSRS